MWSHSACTGRHSAPSAEVHARPSPSASSMVCGMTSRWSIRPAEQVRSWPGSQLQRAEHRAIVVAPIEVEPNELRPELVVRGPALRAQEGGHRLRRIGQLTTGRDEPRAVRARAPSPAPRPAWSAPRSSAPRTPSAASSAATFANPSTLAQPRTATFPRSRSDRVLRVARLPIDRAAGIEENAAEHAPGDRRADQKRQVIRPITEAAPASTTALRAAATG